MPATKLAILAEELIIPRRAGVGVPHKRSLRRKSNQRSTNMSIRSFEQAAQVEIACGCTHKPSSKQK